MASAVDTLKSAGAEQICGGTAGGGEGYSHANTVLKVAAEKFISDPETLQTEAFGASTLIVVAESIEQISQVLGCLEGNLTGCVYSATDGSDDASYDAVVPNLRQKVGRLINDKMPCLLYTSPSPRDRG